MFTAAVKPVINYTTKTGVINDATDYSALNLAQVQVTGTYTFYDDGGAIVATGTIDISAGDTNSAAFNMPLDSNGNVLSGQYRLVYTPTFAVSAFSVSSFTTAPDTIVIASVDWTDIFDEAGASNSVTIAAATTPGNDGAAPITGAALVAGDTVLSTSKTLTAEAGGSATITFSVTYNDFVDDTYTFASANVITPSVAVTYDCESTQNGQIIFTDTTELPSGQTASLTTWSIAYPTNLTNPDTPANIVVTNQESVVVNTLATGQWTYRLTYVVQVVQEDGLIYTYSATTGAVPVEVTCAGTFCELICGIKTLYDKFGESVSCGTPNAQYASAIALIPGYYIVAIEAKKCGDIAKYNEYFALIEALIGDCKCGCEDCSEDSDSGNHWIDNSAFTVGTPQFSPAIYQNSVPFGGSTPSGIDAVQPNSGMLNKIVKPAYFQFANEMAVENITYGEKVVEINFKTYNGSVSTASMVVSIGGQNITSALLAAIPADFSTRTEITIGTKRNGTSTVFGVQVRTDQCDNGNSTQLTETTYEEFADLISSTDDLVVSLTPGGVGVAGLITTQYSIKPYQTT